MAITLTINGTEHQYAGDPSMPILWYVRDILGLHGTKYGCGTGQCGSCTIHLDGAATRSCLLTVEAAAGKQITTIEGLDAEGNHPVQQAWREHNVPQCGYCQTGQIMNAAAFLTANPNPTTDDIDQHMAGNICRCGCYQRIHNAVASAATQSKEA